MIDKNNKIKERNTSETVMTRIMSVFAVAVLCVFPIVYDNFYFNILETKYKFYCACVISMLAGMVCYGLYSGRILKFFKNVNIKDMVKRLNIVDWALLVFWLANVISWLNCEWPWEAFWGTSGRYNGVFLMTLYMLAFFLTTRFFKLKRIYLDVFLLVSVFVCLFGITDYFQLDLLGFKELMMEKQKAIYTSTIGNINTYTVYVGAVLCVSMILFVLETCKKRTIYYFGVMAVSMVALIVGTSDNAYLTLAALFGFSPLYLFRKKTWLKKYIASVATFFTSIVFVGWMSRVYADMVYELDSIFKILAGLSMIPIVAIALWGIVAILTVAETKSKEKSTDELGKKFVVVWTAVIAVVVLAVVYILYDANIAGNAEKYEAVKNYVVYNESWGTNRGFVWNGSLKLYNEVLTPVQKVFGYGADTFKLLMMQHFPPKDGYIYDSAHNEYLHFLVTIGFVGMASYIAILGTSIISMASKMKNRPEVAAILFTVLAYAVQATVNINLPVVFPLIWQLLAMGLSKLPAEE